MARTVIRESGSDSIISVNVGNPSGNVTGIVGDKGDKGDKGIDAWGAVTGDITDQTDLINLFYTKTDINSKNTLQDSAITELQDKNVTQDAAIELRAITAEVGAALDLKANTSDVNSKNTLQDNAITAAQNKADAAIPKSEKGEANGVATLGTDGKISPLQIPTEQPIAWGDITGSIADQTDLGTAATKDVGVGVGQIPLVENIPELAKTPLTYTATTVKLPNLAVDSEGTLKRSTTLLGTAATKNTGSSSGDVMTVGFQGIGKTGYDSNKDVGNLTNMNSELSSDSIPHLINYTLGDAGEIGYPGAVFFKMGVTSGISLLYSNYEFYNSNKFPRMLLHQGIGTASVTTTQGDLLLLGINVTKDANGFLKAASPVVDMYDNKIDLNHDATEQGSITFERLGTGDYLIKGSLGFAQEGWYIEMPKDANGNVLVAVVYEQLANNDISIKTYAKRFDDETGDIVANLAKPRDIPTGRFISLRLHELPVEIEDDINVED